MRFPADVPELSVGAGPDRVRVRAHTEADVVGVYEQCQDPASQRWTTVPVPYDIDDAHRFVHGIVPSGWADGSSWLFAVEAVDDDGVPRFAGSIALEDKGERRAEVSYGAHPWVRGRGVMERALRLLLEWGFAEQELHTVVWWANQGNWASRKLAWRLGFTMDGAVRSWLPQRGELLDAWFGVLLEADERAPRHAWLEVPRLVGPTVVLRAHRASDALRVAEACSDVRTQYWFHDIADPYTLADAESYLAGLMEQRATGKGISWAVTEPDRDVLVANISLFDLKPGREAEIGYWTHPEARGRGVMTQACGLALRHAFVPEEDGGLGLRRVIVYAAEANSASRRVIEANGFVEVGRERRGIKVRGGELVDTTCYDMLVEEYVAPDS